MLVSYTFLLAFVAIAQAHFIAPITDHLARRAELQACTNIYSTFTDSSDPLSGWELENGSSEKNYKPTPEGLEIMILPPSTYEPAMNTSENPALPYNKIAGQGFTFNATTYMQYGKFTATVKSAKVPGAVTAIILIADNGDEIDFEILAGGDEPITSNYFYGKKIIYGVNGKTVNPPGAPAYDEFYSYTIDWSPEIIRWSINGNEIRTQTRKGSKNGNEYPTGAARAQIGLWDGSAVSSTAQWARGPINWSQQTGPVAAYIKDVKIECNSQYNRITK